MAVREKALLALGLPAGPVEELWPLPSGGEALRAASALVLINAGDPLQLAFEAALYDLLGEARYPAPAPLRSASGALIAGLDHGAAAAFAWPPGEPVANAEPPQLLEVGRLLARLHQLGEAHPASVADPCAALLARLPQGGDALRIAAVLREPIEELPRGAAHGGLVPMRALFLGARCSAVLPSGFAASMPLVLDFAEAALGWAFPLERPGPPLRALLSGYQAQRKLAAEEREGLWPALRRAAAREGARRLLGLSPGPPLVPLQAVEALGREEVRAAARCAGRAP